MQRTLIRAAAAALLCAGALAACGGGGSSSGVTPTVHSTATPTPTPTPTATPSQTNSGTATVTSAATAAPIPAAGGFTGTLNLAASNASGSVTLSLTTSTVAPPNLAPMAARRSSASRRNALPSGSSVLLYETLTSPVTITFNATPEIDLTLPAGIATSGVQFFIAAYDPTYQQWQEPAAGPAAVSGQNLTFASEAVPFTMQAGVTYTIALYSAPIVQPTATPTATPTTQPTATPTPQATATPPASSGIALTPSSLSLAVNQIGTFTASEANYSGAFSAVVSSGTCEVWAPNGSYVNGVPSAPDGVFDVDLADTNPCSITVSDAGSNTASMTVTASVSAMSISPDSLTLSGTGSANAQSFTVNGGLAPFTTDGYDSSIISVTPDQLDQSIFHVTPLKAGQTTITIHDSTGHTTTLSVGVTTVSGVIQ